MDKSKGSKELKKVEMEKFPGVIGIDIGTKFSSVGVWKDSKHVIIPDKFGNLRIPTVILFSKEGILFGEEAMNKFMKQSNQANPKNLVQNFPRLLGGKFDDVEVNELISRQTYEIVNSNNHKKLWVKVGNEKFYIEELMSMFLMHLKGIAEKFLEQTVSKAVVAIPSIWNDCQRRAMKNSMYMCGLECVQLINSTSSISVAHTYKDMDLESHVLILDLGAGYFSACISEIDEGVISQKSFKGDPILGGDDIDQCLYNWYLKDLKDRKKIEISQPRFQWKIRRILEQTKMKVLRREQQQPDDEEEVTLEVSEGNLDHVKISRRLLDKLMSSKLNYYKRITEIINNAITESKVAVNRIKEIILVGGCSKNRAIVNDVLKSNSCVMNNKPFKIVKNVDDYPVTGAIVYAAKLSGQHPKNYLFMELILFDTLTRNIGLDGGMGQMVMLFPKNKSVFPCSGRMSMTTVYPFQQLLKLKIYEGDSLRSVYSNKLICKYRITGFQPTAKRGGPKITIKFEVDVSGILIVTANVEGKEELLDVSAYGKCTSFTKEEIEVLKKRIENLKEKSDMKSMDSSDKSERTSDMIKLLFNDQDSMTIFGCFEIRIGSGLKFNVSKVMLSL